MICVIPDLISEISMSRNHALGFQISPVSIPALHLSCNVRRSYTVGCHITGTIFKHAVSQFHFVISIRFQKIHKVLRTDRIFYIHWFLNDLHFNRGRHMQRILVEIFCQRHFFFFRKQLLTDFYNIVVISVNHFFVNFNKHILFPPFCIKFASRVTFHIYFLTLFSSFYVIFIFYQCLFCFTSIFPSEAMRITFCP